MGNPVEPAASRSLSGYALLELECGHSPDRLPEQALMSKRMLRPDRLLPSASLFSNVSLALSHHGHQAQSGRGQPFIANYLNPLPRFRRAQPFGE